MKKRVFLTAIILLCTFLLTGCGCDHQWSEADCVSPRTCALCAATEGEALGHDWADPDCCTPRTCTRCTATEGEALGHDWADPDCCTPRTCTRCTATEGEALGHSFMAPDCVNPMTCAICAATEGEALGHKWQEATCLSPKTCTRCAETEGGQGAHRFGDWRFYNDKMTRTCLNCRMLEESEIDGALLLAEKLTGTWVYTGVEKGGRFIDAGTRPADGLDPYFYFDTYGGASTLGAAEDDEFTWVFTEYEIGTSENTGRCRFKVQKNGEDYAALCLVGLDSERYLELERDGELCILRKDPEHLILAEIWACAEESDYILNLGDDHRFIGYFDGETVSGWWQMRPMFEKDGYGALPLLLCFDEPADRGTVIAVAQGLDPEKKVGEQRYSLNFRLSDNYKELSLYFSDSTHYEAVGQALSVNGTWISTNLEYYNWHTGEEYSTAVTDYSVSVCEDGRFEAVLMDGEVSGRWELSDVDVAYGYGDHSFFYNVFIGGSSDRFCYFQILGEDFFLHTQDSYSYTMQQMDEQELAEFKAVAEKHSTAVLGDWTSTAYSVSDFSSYTATFNKELTGDYSVSFMEDGTFTAVLDREYSGTWTPLRVSRHEYGITYSYDLAPEGVGSDAQFYCYLGTENGVNTLSLSTFSEDGMKEYSYSFMRMYGPEWEDYLSQQAQLVGLWLPVEALWYNEATGEFEPQEVDKTMYLDVREDSTFTGIFPDAFEGIWTYEGLDKYEQAQYHFSTKDGSGDYFYLQNGFLTGWYFGRDGAITVYMEKGSAEDIVVVEAPAAVDTAAAVESAGDSEAAYQDLPLTEKLPGSWVSKNALIKVVETQLSEAEYRYFTFNADGSFEYSDGSGASSKGSWSITDEPTELYGMLICHVQLSPDDGGSMELTLSEGELEGRIAPLMLTLSEGDVFSGSMYYFTKD